jgi:hypothetical protein
MPDALTREEQDAAFILVGEFLYHWAYLEMRITEGIKIAVQGQSMQELDVMLANVSFRDKISMLSTFANILIEPIDKAKAEAASSLFGRINNFSGTYRNVLMHNPFVPLTDGIEIGRIRAKGKFDRPETIWDREFFEIRFQEIDDFDYELYVLLRALEMYPRPADFSGLMNPKPQWETPIQDIYARGLWSFQDPPPEDSKDFPPWSATLPALNRKPDTEPPKE